MTPLKYTRITTKFFACNILPLTLSILLLAVGCSNAERRTGNPTIDLRSTDGHVFLHAINNVVESGDFDAIPTLIYNLRSTNSSVRLLSYGAMLQILEIDLDKYKEPWGYNPADQGARLEAGARRIESWYKTKGQAAVAKEIARRKKEQSSLENNDSEKPKLSQD